MIWITPAFDSYLHMAIVYDSKIISTRAIHSIQCIILEYTTVKTVFLRKKEEENLKENLIKITLSNEMNVIFYVKSNVEIGNYKLFEKKKHFWHSSSLFNNILFLLLFYTD